MNKTKSRNKVSAKHVKSSVYEKINSKWKGNDLPNFSNLVRECVDNELIFRPAPPGDVNQKGKGGLVLQVKSIKVDVLDSEMKLIEKWLSSGLLNSNKTKSVIEFSNVPKKLKDSLLHLMKSSEGSSDWDNEIERSRHLDKLALLSVKIIDRVFKSLLNVEPLKEIHFSFTDRAKVSLAIAWEAMVERGTFPLPPVGSKRFKDLQMHPCGAMHFVSASDLDAGHFYSIGISQSPEAQALQTTDVAYGLDGELIVPGQAVSPIPPFLAMATRLFAASIATSSNISEEVHSIPMRNFPHPTSVTDLTPHRGGIIYPSVKPKDLDRAITGLRVQLRHYEENLPKKQADNKLAGAKTADVQMPKVGVVFDVTDMTVREIENWLEGILNDKELNEKKKLIALYLNIEETYTNRVEKINSLVDIAAEFGLRYVAIADDVEDPLLPDLLEYLEPYELNDVADHADAKGVIVIDGRPIDPVYTASTASQRIQSVFTTLSVDILKMGMWLCLDALNARRVWREILSNPHFYRKMMLMPIGIVEPWNAFVDNRNPNRTARAILDPFEKIKFMIQEAKLLGIPSLLTDTRHKEEWVLLGRKSPSDEQHPREDFVTDPQTGEILGRTDDSAIPLLTWKQFMECEKLARDAGIFLGQAGSIERDQVFKIISETTYSAAKEGLNPATAIWTAETERVLRTSVSTIGGDLQKERSSGLSPFLAVINRGTESHAKMDGWLRYLGDRGLGQKKLQNSLKEERKKLTNLLDACLKAQQEWKQSSTSQNLAHYQDAWDKYRREYIAYHNLIKANFLKIRKTVESEWTKTRARTKIKGSGKK